MRIGILTIILVLGIGSLALAQVKQVTYTAPIPPPNANVGQIIFFDQGASIGGSCDDLGAVQVVAALGALVICENPGPIWNLIAGVWTQDGDTIFLTDDTNPEDIFVGIGTTTPDLKLHLEGDGGIIANGTFNTGVDVGTPGAGTRFMWSPRNASLRAGQITGTQWDSANIGNHSIAFGLNTSARSEKSSVLGGENNGIMPTSTHSVILGGKNNTINDAAANSSYSVIGGGSDNSLDGIHNVIAGGSSHSLPAANNNTISGGHNNSIVGLSGWDTIGGGANNSINSLGGATVGGGFDNDAHGQAATVAGGWNNDIKPGSIYATIGGGFNNESQSQYSTIAGGNANRILGSHWSTIGGGYQNDITGAAVGMYNVVAGGIQNKAAGTNIFTGGYASVVGGRSNQAIEDYAFAGGGQENVASGKHAVAIGGGGATFGNNAQADHSVIVGGASHMADGLYSFIGGGQTNRSSGDHSTISGGQDNTASGAHSTIIGGRSNNTNSLYGTISGGQNNQNAGNHAAILGGEGNIAWGAHSLSFGQTSEARKPFAIALGENNVADGDNAIALGRNMNTTANNSFIYGDHGTGFTNSTADTTLFYIAGNFGIGQANGAEAPDKKLEVDGEAEFHGDIWAKGIHYPSDQTLKTNVARIQNSLDKIDSLNGVNFEWAQDSGLVEKGKDIGVISQEVEKVFPEAVSTNNGIKTVDYSRLVAPLIEAVKELDKKINLLEEENKLLKERITTLEDL